MKLILIGAGGHSRVVLDAIYAERAHEVLGLLDADPSRWGTELDGAQILGGDDLVGQIPEAEGFLVSLGSLGDSRLREKLFAKGLVAGLSPAIVVHADATVSPRAELGPGTVVFAGARVNAGARVGTNAIVNTGAVVEHDAVVGDHVHVCPGAILLGGARIDAGAHVGAGATVLQLVSVGARGIIGAGAVVIRDVEAGTTVAGVPARALS